MLESIKNVFKIGDLRKKILYTMLMIALYRLGGHIPAPGINAAALKSLFESLRGSVFGLYDIFAGGALRRASVFALGVMPYISASIIIQVLGSVFPQIQKLQKDQEGRRKLTQYTRYLTVLIAIIQAFGIAYFLETRPPTAQGPIVANPGLFFKLLTIITLTTGTLIVMWIGELITERGIGNGISFIIFIGCVDNFPQDIGRTIQMAATGSLSYLHIVLILLIVFFTYGAVVAMTAAVRKVPVNYPKKIVGRRMYGGMTTHIPVRLNVAGVIPIIFAQSFIMIPSNAMAFIKVTWLQSIISALQPTNIVYDIIYALLIIFFAYFYTSIVFNPQDLADNMRRYGGFIPGIRPGEKTVQYLDRIISRLTLPGAIFLAIIALLPWYLMRKLHVPFYFGGTTLLIIVGVALDTLQQIESHLLMRHYEGLLKKTRIKGRLS